MKAALTSVLCLLLTSLPLAAQGKDAKAPLADSLKAAPWRALWTGGFAGELSSMRLSPDASLLALAKSNGVITLLDMATGKDAAPPLAKVAVKGPPDYRSLLFSPDGAYLVSLSFKGTSDVWDVKQRKPIGKIPFPAIAFLPDGKSFLAVADPQTVAQYEMPSGKRLGTIHKVDANVQLLPAVFVSGDGKLALIRVKNKPMVRPFGETTILIDLDNKKPAWTSPVDRGGKSDVRDILFARDNKRLLYHLSTGVVEAWDLEAKKDAFRFVAQAYVPPGEFRMLFPSTALSSDGSVMAVSAKNQIEWWDTAANKRLHSQVAHKTPVGAMLFSPDDRILISTSPRAPTSLEIKAWTWQSAATSAK